ncbi:GTP-binding protein [Shigella flexneri]
MNSTASKSPLSKTIGEVSINRNQLIGDRAAQIKTLTNGCICCTALTN